MTLTGFLRRRSVVGVQETECCYSIIIIYTVFGVEGKCINVSSNDAQGKQERIDNSRLTG